MDQKHCSKHLWPTGKQFTNPVPNFEIFWLKNAKIHNLMWLYTLASDCLNYSHFPTKQKNLEWLGSWRHGNSQIYGHNILQKYIYGILFSTKRDFFWKCASACFYPYQGSPVACVSLEKVYEIFSWKSNDWLIGWLAALLAY